MAEMNEENTEQQEEGFSIDGEHKVDDPLFVFLYKWRNTIFTIIVLCACGYFIYQQVITANLNAQRSASDTFEEFKQEFNKISSVGGDKQADAKIMMAFQEKLSVLENGKEPYADLAKIYKYVLDAKRGELKDYDAAAKYLSSIPADKEPYKGAKLFAEMAEVFLAKMRMAQPESRIAGFQSLLSIASRAQYANVKVEAGVAAARLVSTEEERIDVKNVLEELEKNEPAYADEIAAELDKLS